MTDDSGNVSLVNVRVGNYRGAYNICDYSNSPRYVGRHYSCHEYLGDVVALTVESEEVMHLALCEVSVYGELNLEPPCWSNPCGNGGTCVPNEPDKTFYICNCPDSWRGLNCEGTNWAYGKMASMSRRIGNGEAPKTVDGNREGMMTHGNIQECKETGTRTNPWWMVNLQTAIEVNLVLIVNRQDCCSSDLDNFDVSVRRLDENGTTCGPERNNMSGIAWKYVRCDPNVTGTHVRITLYGELSLTLCEVEVYGLPKPCLSNPCDNIRTCHQFGNKNSYECRCPPGFNGTSCPYAIPCWSNPCQNGGSCREIDKGTLYQCSCPANSTGSTCGDVRPCWSNPCVNGGTCKANDASYTCNCALKWTGTNCELTKERTKELVRQGTKENMTTATKVLIGVGVGTSVVVAGGGAAAVGYCSTPGEMAVKIGGRLAMKSIKQKVLANANSEDDEEEEVVSMWDYFLRTYFQEWTSAPEQDNEVPIQV